MSARVLPPVSMSELCKLRTPTAAIQRNMPSSRDINRIKKALFGYADPGEIKKSRDVEIGKHQDLAQHKWGFNFRTGYPVIGHSQYYWEPVGFSEFIPQVYTLSHAAHVRDVSTYYDEPTTAEELLDERAARQNNESLNKSEESSEDETNLFKIPREGVVTRSSTNKKRQPKITDYMKERKRLIATPKKVSPAKRMRPLSFTATSSSTPSKQPRGK